MDVEDNNDDVQPGPSSHSDEADPTFDNNNVCFICESAIDKKINEAGKRSLTAYRVSRPSVQDRLIVTFSV